MHTITKHDLTEDGTACIRRSYMLCQIITQRNISNNIQALNPEVTLLAIEVFARQ